MALYDGQDTLLYVAAGAAPANPSTTANYTVIEEQISHNGSKTRGVTEVSNKQSSGVAVDSQRQGTLTISLHNDRSAGASSGQGILLAAARNGTRVTVLAYPGVGTLNGEYGTYYVTEEADTSENAAKETLTFTLRLDGDVTAFQTAAS